MKKVMVSVVDDYIGMPDNFKYKNRAELASDNFMKGSKFSYKSKYGGTLVITCRNVLVQTLMSYEAGIFSVDADADTNHKILIISDNGAQYDWADCTLVE